jgi:hypothetical protein
MPVMRLASSASGSGTHHTRTEFSKLPFDPGELRLRERCMREVLQINLALWGMIACSAIKVTQHAF